MTRRSELVAPVTNELLQDELQSYTLEDLMLLLRVSRSTLRRLRLKNGFPAPVFLAGNANLQRWPARAVREWAAAHTTLIPVVEKVKPQGRRTPAAATS